MENRLPLRWFMRQHGRKVMVMVVVTAMAVATVGW